MALRELVLQHEDLLEVQQALDGQASSLNSNINALGKAIRHDLLVALDDPEHPDYEYATQIARQFRVSTQPDSLSKGITTKQAS